MNKKKLIIRLSNEIGNQMFMYAAAYSISKQMNRELLLDNESAFLSKKNISKFGLQNFNISANIANDELKFKKMSGYILRKFQKKTDFFRKEKKFFIEKKDVNKITEFDLSFIKNKFYNNFFLEGHFESEKYFLSYKSDIYNEFNFKDENEFKKVNYYDQISKSNSVGICLRQNRFQEGRGKLNDKNIQKSIKFVEEQIKYINDSVSYLNEKFKNLNFFIWSNDSLDSNDTRFNFDYTFINLKEFTNIFDLRILSLYLLSNCNHFIVAPSSFNWWGAWLSKKKEKLVLRPSENFFTLHKFNNKDFWPKSWIKIEDKDKSDKYNK